MGHTWKDESHLKKWLKLEKSVNLGKMCHTWKKGSHFEKRFKLKKIRHTRRASLNNVSHLKKRVTFRQNGHTWKIGTHLKNWITLGKIGKTWKNGSHLEEFVTLRKNCLR